MIMVIDVLLTYDSYQYRIIKYMSHSLKLGPFWDVTEAVAIARIHKIEAEGVICGHVAW